MADYVLIVLIV